MKRAKVVLGLLAAFWGTACGKSTSNSIVVVTVTPAPSAPAVTQLRVVLTNGSLSDTVLFPETNTSARIEWNASFAVTFPKSRGGELGIAIDALDASSNVVASGNRTVAIVVGGRAEATIPLTDRGSTDGGIPDSGLGEAGAGAAEAGAADARMPLEANVPDVSVGRDSAGLGGSGGAGGANSTGGIGGGGGGTTGTGGMTGGTGGRTGTGGTTTGTGGASTAIPDSGVGGSDGGIRRDVGAVGTGGAGTGGVTGTGGTTTTKDAAPPAPDSAGNCLSPVISNGYTCGRTPACSACVIQGVSQEAGCKKGLDCLEAAGGASCIGNCQLICLNTAGDSQIQKCITAIVTAACSGSGC